MKEYTYIINGKEYKVAVNSVEGDTALVTVNGKEYSVKNASPDAPAFQAPAAPAATPQAPAPSAASNQAPAAQASGESKAVNAPLPGVIISVNVKEGDTVKAGDTLAVLEAMKMENSIEAEFPGTVTKVHVKPGDSVLEGVAIVSIA